jgi:hypothetical protein
VFLRIKADDERGHVDDLLSHARGKHRRVSVNRKDDNEFKGAVPYMSLSDEDAGMMYALCETGFEHHRLEPTFKEILYLEREHIVETLAGLVEHADADEAADEGVAFEQALWVLVVEFEELTGCSTDFGEGECDAPDFAFVAEAVFACELCACVG